MDIFSDAKTIGTHSKAVTALKYSPSLELLISASADQTCQLFRAEDCAKIGSFGPEHSQGLNDVVWLNNCGNSTVATASDDTYIKIWDVETSAVVSTLAGHENFIFSLTTHPDQSYLVSGSEDETLRLWDLRCAARCVHCLQGAHEEPVTGVTMHPTGDHVASCSYDGLLRLWDFRTLACRRSLLVTESQTPIAHVQYTPNGRFLLASTLDSTIRLLRPLHTCIMRDAPMSITAQSSKDFYTANVHKRIKRSCPVRSIEVVKTFTGLTNKKYSCPSVFVEAGAGVLPAGDSEAVAAAKNTLLLCGSEDYTVCVWELQSQRLLGRLAGHTGPVLALAHSSRVGGQVASGAGGGDCSVKVWSEKSEES